VLFVGTVAIADDSDVPYDFVTLDYTCDVSCFWAIPSSSPIIEIGMRFTNPSSHYCVLKGVQALLYNSSTTLTDTTGDLKFSLYQMADGYPFDDPLLVLTVDNSDFVGSFSDSPIVLVSKNLGLDERPFSGGGEWLVTVTTATAPDGDTLLFLSDGGDCPQQRLMFDDGLGPFKYGFIDLQIDYNMHIYCVIDTIRPIGDIDGSGYIDIDDVVWLLSYIFYGGPYPVPFEFGDPDCSGATDIDDVVYLLEYIFMSGPEPCDPFD
jgi:hypothetical protein